MGVDLERLKTNLESVQTRIEGATRRSGRPLGAVTLVAVTKMVSSSLVRPLISLGARDLGENYPQELWRKAEDLSDLSGTIRWHLIGHLQSNKLKRTAPMVAMIHSVDSLKLLRLLDEMFKDLPNAPRVCLQVNVSEESSKHGWSADAIFADAESVAECRNIQVVGLMTMAARATNAEEARPAFARLREIRDALSQRTGLPLAELSMGMSNDFESAIEEGSTLVRVGSALFEGLTP